MANRSLTFDIFAKDNASGAFNKVGRAAETTGKHMGVLSAHFGHFGAAVRTGVGLAVGAAGIGGLVETFKGFYSEAVEAQKAGAQTAAVIKSTGGVAHISAQQIGDLASSISNKVGVDDEAIQSGENLLLTFTNVRNESGKGKDIFNQATRAIVDMTAGMNNGAISTEGLKASTIQVGKALNDPIKGMTALGKVGVTFTKQQKDQIAGFIKHGQLAKAQGVILNELGKEFGGSAAASATAGQKLGVVWGNIKESIGTALLPAFNAVANWLADKIPKALDTAIGWFHTGRRGVEGLISAFQGEGVTSSGFVGAMEHIGVAVKRIVDSFHNGVTNGQGFTLFLQEVGNAAGVLYRFFMGSVLPMLASFGGFLRDTVLPALLGFGQWLLKIRGWLIPLIAGVLAIVAALRVYAAAMAVVRAATAAWAAVQAILDAVLAANPIGIIILAVIGLAAALIVAWKRSETFRDVVMTVFRGVAGGVLTACKFMLDAVLGFVIGVLHAAGKMPGPLGAPFRTAEKAVRNFRDSADRELAAAQAKVDSWGRAASKPIRKDVTVRVLDRATGVLTTVKRELDQLSGRVVTVTAYTKYGPVTKMSRGGVVTGGTPGRDSVPALLMPGEVVLTVAQARAYRAGHGGGGGTAGTDGEVLVAQFFLDGKMIQESLLTRKRRTGQLGLA
jgi:hypothetical protein